MPFNASCKPYFSEPYVCLLMSKAKLLILNLRQALVNLAASAESTSQQMVESPDFEEINTLINCRYNFKLVVQPLLTSQPTSLIGY